MIPVGIVGELESISFGHRPLNKDELTCKEQAWPVAGVHCFCFKEYGHIPLNASFNGVLTIG